MNRSAQFEHGILYINLVYELGECFGNRFTFMREFQLSEFQLKV